MQCASAMPMPRFAGSSLPTAEPRCPIWSSRARSSGGSIAEPLQPRRPQEEPLTPARGVAVQSVHGPTLRRLLDDVLGVADAELAGDQLRQERVAQRGQGARLVDVLSKPARSGSIALR